MDLREFSCLNTGTSSSVTDGAAPDVLPADLYWIATLNFGGFCGLLDESKADALSADWFELPTGICEKKGVGG